MFEKQKRFHLKWEIELNISEREADDAIKHVIASARRNDKLFRY